MKVRPLAAARMLILVFVIPVLLLGLSSQALGYEGYTSALFIMDHPAIYRGSAAPEVTAILRVQDKTLIPSKDSIDGWKLVDYNDLYFQKGTRVFVAFAVQRTSNADIKYKIVGSNPSDGVLKGLQPTLPLTLNDSLAIRYRSFTYDAWATDPTYEDERWFTFNVDQTPPVTTLDPSRLLQKGSPSFRVVVEGFAKDTESGIAKTVVQYSPGSGSITYYSIDHFGNAEAKKTWWPPTTRVLPGEIPVEYMVVAQPFWLRLHAEVAFEVVAAEVVENEFVPGFNAWWNSLMLRLRMLVLGEAAAEVDPLALPPAQERFAGIAWDTTYDEGDIFEAQEDLEAHVVDAADHFHQAMPRHLWLMGVRMRDHIEHGDVPAERTAAEAAVEVAIRPDLEGAVLLNGIWWAIPLDMDDDLIGHPLPRLFDDEAEGRGMFEGLKAKVQGQGANGWYSSARLTLEAGADLTGVCRMYYRKGAAVSDAKECAYTQPVDLAAGTYTIWPYAQDVAGNEVNSPAISVKVDPTPPVTRATVTAPQGFQSDSWFKLGSVAKVTLEAADEAGGSGVGVTEWSLDGVSWQPYSSPLILSSSMNNTLWYRSKDMAGNCEVPKLEVWGTDATPPVTKAVPYGLDAGGDGRFDGPVLVDMDACDTQSGVRETHYQINNEPPQLYSRPVRITKVGETLIKFLSVDAVENHETAQSVVVRIHDATPPQTCYRLEPLPNRLVRVHLRAFDDLSGVTETWYSVNGGASYQRYDESLSLVMFDDASQFQFFKYYSKDAAGNVEYQYKGIDPTQRETYPTYPTEPTVPARPLPRGLTFSLVGDGVDRGRLGDEHVGVFKASSEVEVRIDGVDMNTIASIWYHPQPGQAIGVAPGTPVRVTAWDKRHWFPLEVHFKDGTMVYRAFALYPTLAAAPSYGDMKDETVGTTVFPVPVSTQVTNTAGPAGSSRGTDPVVLVPTGGGDPANVPWCGTPSSMPLPQLLSIGDGNEGPHWDWDEESRKFVEWWLGWTDPGQGEAPHDDGAGNTPSRDNTSTAYAPRTSMGSTPAGPVSAGPVPPPGNAYTPAPLIPEGPQPPGPPVAPILGETPPSDPNTTFPSAPTDLTAAVVPTSRESTATQSPILERPGVLIGMRTSVRNHSMKLKVDLAPAHGSVLVQVQRRGSTGYRSYYSTILFTSSGMASETLSLPRGAYRVRATHSDLRHGRTVTAWRRVVIR